MTKPKYYLKSEGTNPKETVISENDYLKIIQAKKTLSSALSIEETYNQTIDNYIEFEKEILTLTHDKIFKSSFDYQDASKTIGKLNRRIVNFLYSAKNYTETIPKNASKCLEKDKEIKANLEKLKSKFYDNNLAYRLMENLRNHASHSGSVVHKLHHPDKWIDKETNNERSFIYKIEIYTLKNILNLNDGFNKRTLRELPQEINLTSSSRIYINIISEIHETVREAIKEATTRSRLIIKDHIESFKEENPMVTINKETKEEIKKENLILYWDDVRLALQTKNKKLTHMEKRITSNESPQTIY